MNEPEVYKFNIEVLEETEELLYSDHDVDVVIDYFWDSHGKFVEFHGPNGEHRDEMHADTVRIVEVNRKLKIEDNLKPFEECIWECYVNGERIKCICIAEYNKRKRLFIKAVVGTG